MRGIAILAVVLYHAGAGVTRGGYVGVDVFFVISGFLITGLLWRELAETGRISFRSFYARRARRLLPASVVVVVATLVASVLWLPPLRAAEVANDAVAVSVYAGNYRFAAQETDYLDSAAPPSPLLQYWSLGVEEQFYACWPLILFVASLAWRRRGEPSATAALATLAVVAAASFVACVVVTDVAQPWAFFSLPTRAWELAAGGLVALSAPALRQLPSTIMAVVGWAGMAAIGWSVVALGPSTAFPGSVALLPVAGTVAVVAAGCTEWRPGWAPGTLLGCPPLEAVGRVSYSWYLWHWPVLVLAPVVVGGELGIGARLGLAAASVVPAAISLHLVENPIRFSQWLAWRPGRGLALGGGLTAVSLVAAGVAVWSLPALTGTGGARSSAVAAPGVTPDPSDGGAAAAPEQARRSAADARVNAAVVDSLRRLPVPSDLDPPLRRAHADRARPFVDGCHLSFVATAVRECAYGPPAATTVFLFGDSHATHWFPTLKAAAEERGWRLVSLTKSTCPPVAMPLWSPDLGRAYRECDAWRDAVLARIRAERPAMVVLGSARHYGPEFRFDVHGPQWTAGLGEMVRRIDQAGSRAVVLGPAPHPRVDVPDCLSERLGDVTACAQPVDRAVDRRQIETETTAVERAGGTYIDVAPWFCDQHRCAAVVGNLLVYRDDNHLTTSYAAWLGPAVGAALDSANATGRN